MIIGNSEMKKHMQGINGQSRPHKEYIHTSGKTGYNKEKMIIEWLR